MVREGAARHPLGNARHARNPVVRKISRIHERAQELARRVRRRQRREGGQSRLGEVPREQDGAEPLDARRDTRADGLRVEEGAVFEPHHKIVLDAVEQERARGLQVNRSRQTDRGDVGAGAQLERQGDELVRRQREPLPEEPRRQRRFPGAGDTGKEQARAASRDQGAVDHEGAAAGIDEMKRDPAAELFDDRAFAPANLELPSSVKDEVVAFPVDAKRAHDGVPVGDAREMFAGESAQLRSASLRGLDGHPYVDNTDHPPFVACRATQGRQFIAYPVRARERLPVQVRVGGGALVLASSAW